MYLSIQWYFSFYKLIVKKNRGETGTDIDLQNYMTLYIYVHVYAICIPWLSVLNN